MPDRPAGQSDPRYTALDGIGAIRLAAEAAADGRAFRQVTRAILARVPEPAAGDTASVGLLLDAIRAANAELRVTRHA